MKITFTFGGIVHNENLVNVLSDITSSGGTVLESQINDDESAEVVIEVNNRNEFFEKFKSTNVVSGPERKLILFGSFPNSCS